MHQIPFLQSFVCSQMSNVKPVDLNTLNKVHRRKKQTLRVIKILLISMLDEDICIFHAYSRLSAVKWTLLCIHFIITSETLNKLFKVVQGFNSNSRGCEIIFNVRIQNCKCLQSNVYWQKVSFYSLKDLKTGPRLLRIIFSIKNSLETVASGWNVFVRFSQEERREDERKKYFPSIVPFVSCQSLYHV